MKATYIVESHMPSSRNPKGEVTRHRLDHESALRYINVMIVNLMRAGWEKDTYETVGETAYVMSKLTPNGYTVGTVKITE